MKPAPMGLHEEATVLSFEDCLALCDLTEDEVAAIAEHEHIPQMAAVELGHYLVRTPGGEMRIKAIIRDDIAAARARGDRAAELALRLVLCKFMREHPRCDERCRPRVDEDQGAAAAPA